MQADKAGKETIRRVNAGGKEKETIGRVESFVNEDLCTLPPMPAFSPEITNLRRCRTTPQSRSPGAGLFGHHVGHDGPPERLHKRLVGVELSGTSARMHPGA